MCKYCEFCQKKDDRVEVIIKFLGTEYKCIGDHWGYKNFTTIVYDPSDDSFRLWQDGYVTTAIDKCPKCGRELKSPLKTVDK